MPSRIVSQEFENLNGLRSYPFSDDSSMEDVDGVAFPCDVFVDAMVYAVNASGCLFLSRFDPMSGELELSDDAGRVVASGALSPGSESVELWSDGRYAGCLSTGQGFDREMASGRTRKFSGTARLASSAVCAIPYDGVSSVEFVGRGHRAVARRLSFSGSGRLVARSARRDDGDTDIWFDVLPERPSGSDGRQEGAEGIKSIVVAVLKGSLVSADKTGPSSAYVFMPHVTRDDICSNADMSPEIAKSRDTCRNPYPGGGAGDGCGPEDGRTSGEPSSFSFTLSGCGVTLTSEDLVNYDNPVKVGVVAGSISPNVPSIGSDTSFPDAVDEMHKVVEKSTTSGNGIYFSVPGVSHA